MFNKFEKTKKSVMKNYFTTLFFMLFGLVAFAQKPKLIYTNADYNQLGNNTVSISPLVSNLKDNAKAEEFRAMALSYKGVKKVDFKDLNSEGNRQFIFVMEESSDPVYFKNFIEKLGVEEINYNKVDVKTVDFVAYYNKQLELNDKRSK